MTDATEPEPEHLARQLVALAHARFDMRSALEIAKELKDHHGRLGPRTFGLLTGLATTYARPFTSSTGGYGTIGQKYSRFPSDRPEFKRHHDRLIELRRTLAAHTDQTPHRKVGIARGALVLPGRELGDGELAVFEGRSAIDASGIAEVIELLKFQEDRLDGAINELARRLVEMGYVPEGAMVEFDPAGGFTTVDPESQTFIDTRLEESD